MSLWIINILRITKKITKNEHNRFLCNCSLLVWAITGPCITTFLAKKLSLWHSITGHVWVIQQCKNLKHTTKEMKERQCKKHFKVLEWLSQSPDNYTKKVYNVIACFVSCSLSALMMKNYSIFLSFKWENLHSWWMIEYFSPDLNGNKIMYMEHTGWSLKCIC